MSQPLEIIPPSESHEEVFLARYDRLRAWALQLTKNDRELSEDLVQDAFVHFTLLRPDLTQMQNLDGYFYSMLRNLYVSHLRRRQRLHSRALSVVEYDSAKAGLRATDARDLVRVRDELRACCLYACIRKESSKMGSVLILRFLHGYYPREIALVMKCSREAVEERLRIARSEAKQYLKSPASLRFMREGTAQQKSPAGAQSGLALTADDLLRDLRRMIFETRSGECLSSSIFDGIYGGENGTPVDCATLAHMVSCPQCLDEINRRLKLAPLSERYPTDTIEKEARPQDRDDDDGGSGDMTGSNPEAEEFYLRCKKRVSEVSEHRPRELCISVNGHLLAAQSIGAPFNEQTLTVQSVDPIEFIEIVTEQEVSLLFLDLSDRVLDGSECQARVELSDERWLQAKVNFNGQLPTVQVAYSDPSLTSENAVAKLDKEIPLQIATASSTSTEHGHPRRNHGRKTFRDLLKHVTRWLPARNFWLKPASVSAALSMVLIAALLFMRLHVPAVSAAELLRRSSSKEDAVASNPNLVLHRTLHFEERGAEKGEVIARRRIEIWQSAARGVKLRRVFDERNNLIGGAWTKADGGGVVYRRGAVPQEHAPQSLATRQILADILAGNEPWLVDLSAKDYSTLVGNPEWVQVEEAEGVYTLSYANESLESTLVSATLTLNKSDLRASDQTVVVRRDGGSRIYHLSEDAYAQLPKSSVEPRIFEPDPVLVLPEAPFDAEERVKTTANDAASTPMTATNPSAIASTNLEVEVTYWLNQIKADLGEQVTLTRTARGSLRVEALVETDERKQEVLRALRPVSNNPAVLIDVHTVDEATKRRQNGTEPGKFLTREVEVQAGRIPADEELRRYFAARLAGHERIEEAISQAAARSMARTRQALLHASALKRLAGRFSTEEQAALAPEARSKWIAMIVQHARAYRREVESMRRELGPIFPASTTAASGASEVVHEATLYRAAERLLQLSYSHDAAVRAAFSLSADAGSAARLRSSEFWRSLRTAEGLAASIDEVSQD